MLRVKPFRQREGYCGPACLKMIFSYYGLERSELELGRAARTSVSQGTHARNLVRVAQSFGFKAVIQDECTFQNIAAYLRKRVPIIVNWFSVDDGHYSVVVGLDTNYIYLQDPEIGKIRKLSRKTFMRVWFDFRGNYLKSRDRLVLRRIISIEKK